MAGTPNAERYVLEADALRRRQLRSAMLHGSRRTWREHRKVWPAVLVGIIAVAVIVGAMAVMDAFDDAMDDRRSRSTGALALSAVYLDDRVTPHPSQLSRHGGLEHGR